MTVRLGHTGEIAHEIQFWAQRVLILIATVESYMT